MLPPVPTLANWREGKASPYPCIPHLKFKWPGGLELNREWPTDPFSVYKRQKESTLLLYALTHNYTYTGLQLEYCKSKYYSILDETHFM